MAKRINVLYINDLLSKSNKIKKELKSTRKAKYYIIDWTVFNLFGKSNNLIEYYSQIILEFFKEHVNKTFDVIIDSFAGLIFCNVYEQIKSQINKMIIINPFTNYIYLKSWTIKHIWLPKNRRNMIYKQMYIFHNFNVVRDNEIFLEQMHKELAYMEKYEFRINKMFNEILAYNNVKLYLKFIRKNEHNIIFFVGENSALYSLKDIHDFKNKKQENYFLFKSCGYNILWEQTLEFKKFVSQII